MADSMRAARSASAAAPFTTNAECVRSHTKRSGLVVIDVTRGSLSSGFAAAPLLPAPAGR